ncbi:arylsulfatase [Variovorax sp. WS11]|uniref:arylsulfatase n=1 Tax=Variovorax sp. WS11 TaxID=1105204 RepID=UPI0013D9351D|nr:arylsulfatase [Variovorax sp. WS11]NDZ17071.1 arylsulfatase [Variovorax sp. WS11]
MNLHNTWPKRPTAKGSPNVLLFLTDDVGFGACSTFGGPIQTPNLDALAGSGVRFSQFHTTAMCSPTRAALLTGRNSHRVGMGRVTARPSYYDGYTSVIPRTAGTIADILRASGYHTAMFGKGHITPEWEMSALGPFDRWPTGLGFDYFYGFLGFDTNMWAPDLVENTTYIDDKHAGKHFDETLADCAIQWIFDQKATAPEEPFFIYYASGTAHSPHHAPEAWLQKYRGRFDLGWDELRRETFERQKRLKLLPQDTVLTERPDNLPAWTTLSPTQKLLASRLMEAYAAALDHCDHHVGRILASLKELGELDNTFVLFIQGDNGGSAEGGFNGLLFEQSWANGFDEAFEDQLKQIHEIGGPKAYNHFPAAWGWAINAPFKYYKQVASHFGGTRNGLVMSWPGVIADHGSVRAQFHHVVDVLPTILEAAGVEAPNSINGILQDSIDGTSMLYAARSAEAPPARITQVFESMQNVGVYHDGWMACSTPENDPWEGFASRKTTELDDKSWELYYLSSDFSQAIDLASREPERLEQMKRLFGSLAASNNILPIHSPALGAEGKPSLGSARRSFSFRRRIRRLHNDAAPHTVGRSFTINCKVVVGPNGGNGVIACHGSSVCGYSFYLKDSIPVFYYNAISPCTCRVAATQRLNVGESTITARLTMERNAPGAAAKITIEVNGAVVAEGRVARTLRTFLNQNGFNVGGDSVSATSPEYKLEESEFDGELGVLTFDLA